MEFANDTALPAQLFTGFIGEDVIEAQIVARATYRLDEGGRLSTNATAWPIFTSPIITDLGPFPIDRQAARKGCDVVVTGVVRPREPVPSASVTLRIGAHRRDIQVFGDRVWEGGGEDLEPSDPEPFTEMPLVWERAFGGMVEFEDTQGGHMLNPRGVGYYLTAEAALGKPLPNLEDPGALIEKWDHRPKPNAWASVVSPLSWYAADCVREGGTPEEVLDRLAKRAVLSACRPDMVLDGVSRATELSISGTGRSDVTIRLDEVACPVVEARFGDERLETTLPIAGLWVFLEEKLVVVTFRAELRGNYRRHESRAASLRIGKGE